jgi:hypothetical protein
MNKGDQTNLITNLTNKNIFHWLKFSSFQLSLIRILFYILIDDVFFRMDLLAGIALYEDLAMYEHEATAR